MSYYSQFPPYVSVAKRRLRAEKKLKQLKKLNSNISPVILKSGSLAKNWWGKSWNKNLERYESYSHRLERGRSYLRHGSVLDLQIKAGEISGLVLGGEKDPYEVQIEIKKLTKEAWSEIKLACQESFSSLGDLLAGEFPESFKELFFKEEGGLFPCPEEINLNCNCPDYADVCKHIGAVLYGVGVRLDFDQNLFFQLRGVDVQDLVSESLEEATSKLLSKAKIKSGNIVDDDSLESLGNVFGIEIDDGNLKEKVSKDESKRKSKSRNKKIRNANEEKKPATMNELLLKAIGRSQKGKSVDDLLLKLDWSRAQLYAAISRARAKGNIEIISPGRYRRV